MSACRAIALILLLSVAAAAQTPVWTASVMDFNDQFVFLEFQRDGVRVFAERYPIPATGMGGVRVIVRDEIKRLQAKQAAGTIVPGSVTPALDDQPPPPPPIPTPEQVALAAFLRKIELYRVLRDFLPANNQRLTALRDSIIADWQAHPEWEDAL